MGGGAATFSARDQRRSRCDGAPSEFALGTAGLALGDACALWRFKWLRGCTKWWNCAVSRPLGPIRSCASWCTESTSNRCTRGRIRRSEPSPIQLFLIAFINLPGACRRAHPERRPAADVSPRRAALAENARTRQPGRRRWPSPEPVAGRRDVPIAGHTPRPRCHRRPPR